MEPLELDRPKEECGIFGVFAPKTEVAKLTFFGLFALQHRGQESAGIAVSDGSTLRFHKGMGLVSQVFTEQMLSELQGDLAVGHTRYSTTGVSEIKNAQPIVCQSIVGGVAVAHNGNLINTAELRTKLAAEGVVFTSSNDSEIIAHLLSRHLALGVDEAVRLTMEQIKGAYSVAVLLPDKVVAFRDPLGVRPLAVGRVRDGWMVASETCAFAPVGGKVDRELCPGEMVVLDATGMRFRQVVPSGAEKMCLFEFIYFARPDSRMYGTTIYSARERMGQQLAIEHPVDADIVVPVPDSGIPAALGYSRHSGIPFKEGMTKSRYIHRTFIQPDQKMREMGVRMKLAPLEDHIRGRRIVLVDDSIVRATTTKQLVRLLFEAGAAEVHVRITAPPITNPCFYGIDMAGKGELAAAQMSIEEICKSVGATSLGYLSIEGAVHAVGREESAFCLACFNGHYPLPVPEDLSKHAFETPPDVGAMAAIQARD